MKLPKCPHCEKLLIGVIGGAVVSGKDGGEYRQEIVYFCPETEGRQKPDWVEVLEV